MIKQKGASLIEILIAVVVISVGLLGLAGLQTSSIKSNQSSYLRSQATLLAYDLSDRMRASRDAAENGAFNTNSNHNDKVSWDLLLQQAMGPSAAATVDPIVGANNQFRITITWDDSRGNIGNQANNETFSFIVDLSDAFN